MQRPLSFAQEQLWFLHQLHPEDPSYHVSNAIKISGPLNIAILRQCFVTILRRHESLRTQFTTLQSTPFQAIQSLDPDIKALFYEIDMTLKSQAADVSKLIQQKIAEPFDLSNEVPFKVYLLKLNNEENILLIVIHHIICDGWSLKVLFAELRECYRAYSAGETPSLAPLVKTYADYAIEQREKFNRGLFTDSLSYWQSQLQGMPLQLDMYTDYPRPKTFSTAGQQISYQLNSNTYHAAKQFAKETRSSLFILSLSALYVLLKLYSMQDDITIGVSALNRNDSVLKNIIGLFVNMLPIRVRVDLNNTFNNLMQCLKINLSDGMMHQHIPLEKIIQSLEIERAVNVTPLIQIIAVQTVNTTNVTELSGLNFSELQIPSHTAKYDLAFYFSEGIESYQVQLEFSSLYTTQTAQRFLLLWESIMKHMLVAAEQKILNCYFLSNTEENALKALWTKQPLTYRCCEKPLLELFNQQVQDHPTQVALYSLNQAIDYQTLDAWATKIAFALTEKHMKANDVVAINMHRGINRVASILAVLKIGGIFLSLSPDLPPERIQDILKQAAFSMMLISKENAALEALNLTVLVVPQVIPNNIEKINFLSPARNYQDTAYLIFTSGSSGVPKGILGTHQGILNRLHWAWEKYPFSNNDICCHQASVMFVDAIAEMFAPLLRGIPAYIFPEEMILDPVLFVRKLAEYQITRLLLIPSLLNIIIDASKKINETLPHLTYWMTSGEVLAPSLCKKFFEYFGSKTLINIYGSSEVAADATYHEMQTTTIDDAISIGIPLSNTQVYVLDHNMKPLLPGMPGEIYISGLGVANGYLDDSMTHNTFFSDPYVKTNQRMYRTGDYGYYHPHGLLQILGRQDHQIKIRGMRIELGEIEANLQMHSAIADAAVTLDNKDTHLTQLIAYIVLRSHSNATNVNELRQFLSTRLPDYMLPQQFKVVSALPRTATGKLNRKQLMTLNSVLLNSGLTFIEATTPTEIKIAAAWKIVLEKNAMSIHDNFFAAGGNSLLLVKLKDVLESQLQQPILLADLFEYPTIHSFGRFISKIELTTQNKSAASQSTSMDDIAIIGMAGRFPNATNLNEFWDNLFAERESIRTVSDAALPVDLTLKSTTDKWVNKSGVIDSIEYFDAHFFDFKPKEAELLDPQHRIFLENAWEALENAGYTPESYPGTIGIYTGAAPSTYLLSNLFPYLAFNDPNLLFLIMISNNENYLATRIAYKLNLRGPCVSIQTACSTSLVAIHMACRTLQTYDADMMLAGGVSIKVPQNTGYIYQEGSVVSPDGKCRAFDEEANGTIFTSGSGVVVLKRLKDALAEGDMIHAVIKGSAINNDGSEKMGYAAPSVKGQKEVIQLALQDANLTTDDISYIETHGTGTSLGDTVELSALDKVYTHRDQHIGIGSIKSNIGHLDVAAGIASLIKVIFALKHEYIPASLHFTNGNKKIDWQASAFHVVNKTKKWPKSIEKRRAAVSSFGIGGTNAHLVVEEAPVPLTRIQIDKPVLMILSAPTASALQILKQNLLAYVKNDPSTRLCDIAYTLQVGRKAFAYRWCHITSDRADFIAALSQENNSNSDHPLEALQHTTASRISSLYEKASRWLQGETIDWYTQTKEDNYCRVELPTYPFERQKFWVENPKKNVNIVTSEHTQNKIEHNNKARPMMNVNYQPAEKELEVHLINIWQRTLGIDSIGIDDNFFELGGDSLLATQIVSAIKELFPIEVPLTHFFENATVKKLAGQLEISLLDKLAGMSELEVQQMLQS